MVNYQMTSSMLTNKNRFLKTSISLFTILLLFLTWIIISITKDNDLIYPNIDQIFKRFMELFQKENLSILFASLSRLVITIGIAFLITFIIISLYVRVPLSYQFFSPLIKIMRSVPFLSVSIFIILVFGSKNSPYIIALLVVLPVLIEGVKSGVDYIDDIIKDDLKLLEIGFIQKLFYVYIPIVLPTIITSLLQVFGLGFKVMIMGEYFSQTNMSIGKELFIAKSFIEMDSVIAWTIIIVLITSIIEILINVAKRKLIK